jgi:hypothetical protein
MPLSDKASQGKLIQELIAAPGIITPAIYSAGAENKISIFGQTAIYLKLCFQAT